ncbi:MAG: type II secretion system protein GspC [Polyangiales bacterium]
MKRNFWVVIASLGSVTTYFFASGATQLVGGKYLALDSAAATAAPARTAPVTAGSGNTARNLKAKTILESNPFDSITGPMSLGIAEPIPTMPTGTPEQEANGERLFTQCAGGPKLEITIVDPLQPARSFAVLSTGDGSANKPLVREGSTVSGRTVAVIVREKVYFKEASTYCFVGMFMPPPPPAPAAAAAPAGPAGPPSGGAPAPVPADMLKGIQKIDDTNFNIDRNVVDKIIENQAELMKTARIVPEQENGKVTGIRLLNIRPDTLLGVLGLQAGDMLKSINGFDMTSPEKALEAYAKLRTAPSISVGVVRGGKPINIDFNIK